MRKEHNDIIYVFHSNKEHNQLIQKHIQNSDLSNCEVISDDKIKEHLLKKSIFAIVKSGTVSLEVCNAKIPSIIICKMNFINFLIIKILVKIKYANIINFVANKEIIPELLQSKCNSKNIYNTVNEYLESPIKIEKQINLTQEIIANLRTKHSSSQLASQALSKFL